MLLPGTFAELQQRRTQATAPRKTVTRRNASNVKSSRPPMTTVISPPGSDEAGLADADAAKQGLSQMRSGILQ
jgi:hypothetical protein